MSIPTQPLYKGGQWLIIRDTK